MEKFAVITSVVRIVVESSSSSDSDSDEEEMQEILIILDKDRCNNVPRIRCQRYVEDVVSRYTEMDFKNHFRYVLYIFVFLQV